MNIYIYNYIDTLIYTIQCTYKYLRTFLRMFKQTNLPHGRYLADLNLSGDEFGNAVVGVWHKINDPSRKSSISSLISAL